MEGGQGGVSSCAPAYCCLLTLLLFTKNKTPGLATRPRSLLLSVVRGVTVEDLAGGWVCYLFKLRVRLCFATQEPRRGLHAKGVTPFPFQSLKLKGGL